MEGLGPQCSTLMTIGTTAQKASSTTVDSQLMMDSLVLKNWAEMDATGAKVSHYSKRQETKKKESV